MWRSDAVRLKFRPADGLEVVATGTVEVFERAGRYQLYIRKLEPRGVGALELAYRQLCDKLRAAGLFDPAHKKPLPRFPKRIAIVTSPTGAAIADSRRDPAAVISERGLSGADPICEMSLALFCSVLGAVAGNLALAVLATGGVFVAGGIAPRILPYIQSGVFREAFERKGRLHTVIERLPAFVVTHPQIGLLGAATAASHPVPFETYVGLGRA